ncbi:sensor histidine kinase [Nubsella zeaxanthinifaciens]|uniref:sensor histidine kinase n=1 Tax=Nubsella zeaxanthinifaciens TaxID=392412 RepID=UPI0018E594A2|nr:PAS domain S-box protein [Nubsella zeaxanthinifaciens]
MNPKLTASFFFIILIGIICLIGLQRYATIKESREREAIAMLESVEIRLGQLLKGSQNITLTLALTVDKQGNPQNFEQIAAEIYRGNPYLQGVQLAPNGIIKYMYPLKGNERAIGLNVLKTGIQNQLAAKKAVAKRRIYFQGPVNLVQGGQGVVGRLPIFINQKLWGFSAVVIKLNELLKAAGIDNSKYPYYRFQFSKIDPLDGKEEFFLEGADQTHNTFETRRFEEGDWKIYLTDTRSIYTDYSLIALLIFGVILSFLSSYLLLRLLNKQAQLYATLAKQSDMLIDAENKYKTIFDNAAIGIGRVNSITGEFLETNAFLCNLLGYTREELNKKKIKTLIHEDDLAADAKNFKRLRNGEIRQFSSVRRYVNKDKQLIWANAIVSPLWEVGESPDNHIIIVDDITQQIIYEEQIIASQKHIEDLVNSIEGIVWEASVNEQFTNTFISNKIVDILGYTPEEWAAKPGFFFEKMYPEDRERIAEYLKRELFRKMHHEHEYRMIAKDGSIVWIRDSVNIVPNLESPQKLRGIMMDITAIKQAEDTLHKSYELVNEQNKRLLNFSYIVSHNLRSHASNIDGISALISNAETDEERNEMIKLLRKVVINLNDTLYNLNAIVNIQTSINLVKEPLNLLEYVNNAIHTQEAQILSKGATIINTVANDIFVYFNKAYLESILLNLVSNALRYSHALRTPIIKIDCQPNGTGYIFSISDNGVGIDLAKNGEKLFGLNQTFHGNSDARGFGLFITKNQIEAMGDSIEVTSVLGEGTTFRIIFN